MAREAHSRFNACHPLGLPVFLCRNNEWHVLYTPGLIQRMSPADADQVVSRFSCGGKKKHGDRWTAVAEEFESKARKAVEKYRFLENEVYSPECLTAILSFECPLSCSYCFVHPQRSPETKRILDDEVFLKESQRVADHCVKNGKDFILVIHGGGEPTVHMDKIKKIHSMARTIANERDLFFFSYIATAGVVSREDAVWLGKNFSLVGLSCDGPPEIQDRQRPLAGFRPSSMHVMRTAQSIREAGGKLAVRTTITPATMKEQETIAHYIATKLVPREIRVEPVYLQGKKGFLPDHAEIFIPSFLSAQRMSRSMGLDFNLSGVRLNQVHGPYCQVLRQVLQVNPDGSISACFLALNGDGGFSSRILSSSLQPGESGELDHERIRGIRRRALTIPRRCMDCVNMLHCARDCPETCMLELKVSENDEENQKEEGGFRCRVQKGLAEHWIMETAWNQPPLILKKGGMNASSG